MEKRVKHTSYFAAISMPNKVADFGPSPNSLDDNGNVSFESHSGSQLESLKDATDIKKVDKGSGQPELPGQTFFGLENDPV